MAVKASVDTQNQTTVRVGQQNAVQVTSTQTGIASAVNAHTAFNVRGGEADVTLLNVSGVSTFVGDIESNLNITGIVTAVTYYGDGSNLSGAGSTLDISTNSLVVLGISTLGVTSATDLEAQQLYVSGISTLGVSTFTGAVSIGDSILVADNKRIYFGDDQDLSIRHNEPGHSYIQQGSGKDLVIQTGVLRIVNTADNKDLANFTEGSYSRLYYDGTERISTSGLGITVTGVTSTTDLYVTGVSTFNKDVEFVGEGGAGITSAYWDQDASSLKFLDGVKAQFGLSLIHI